MYIERDSRRQLREDVLKFIRESVPAR
jgi:hypothetical protein